MTTINATILDSGSQPIDGFIRVSIDHWIPTNGVTTVSAPFDYVLDANGFVSMELEPSELARVTYLFEVYANLPGVDTETGDPIVVPTLVQPSFRSTIPESTTPILFNELAAQLGVDTDIFERYIELVVARLSGSQAFYNGITSRAFAFKGLWTPQATYSTGSFVSYDGSIWLWNNSESTTGTVPSTVNGWLPLASRGIDGTSTNGNDTPYDAIGWNNQTDAPSRNAIRDLVEDTLVKSSELNGFLVPVGIIQLFPDSASAPSSWLACEGQLISSTTYSELFGVIGFTYGQSGIDFALPNLPAPANTRYVIYTGVTI